MTPKPTNSSCSGRSSADPGNEPAAKVRFIKPTRTCHGDVVDLTVRFGGRLTPDERTAQVLDY